MQKKPGNAPEITLRAAVLGAILVVLLAAANTYLAMKVGILATASIPAAVISMAILRLWRNSTILENNMVQTMASAGEAVAGGIVYTIPALVLLGYWSSFAFWPNCMIALIGGVLGVLFSVPIRRVLIDEPTLRFPEGRAITEILRAGDKQQLSAREIFTGGAIGALLEILQTGLKIAAGQFQWAVKLASHTWISFGFGTSATLLGAGYLIGTTVGISLLVGAIIAWFVCLPALTYGQLHLNFFMDPLEFANKIWGDQIRYIGIGAMLSAGIWMVGGLIKPFFVSLRMSLRALRKYEKEMLISVRQDLPGWITFPALLIMALLLYGLFTNTFDLHGLELNQSWYGVFSMSCVAYVIIFGFMFAAMSAYFSGLVGLTASPGSAIMIASLLLTSLLLRMFLGLYTAELTPAILQSAAAIIIIIGGVIMGAAAMADNIQVMKVGQLLGATPWKQQAMLLFGILIAALVIPPVMQLLFNVYGIGHILPHANMDPSRTLPAPVAAMMAAMTQGIFNHQLPWHLILTGFGITTVILLLNYFIARWKFNLSPLGVGMGMYLPLASSTALFIGSLMSWVFFRDKKPTVQQSGTLLACGLVSGAALMDIMLAIPIGLTGNPDILKLTGLANFDWIVQLLGVLCLLSVVLLFSALSRRSNKSS